MDEKKYCKHCGAVNPTRASFCSKCGTAFASTWASEMPSQSSARLETSPSRLRMCEIGVGLIILVLGIIFWWPGLKFGRVFFAFLAIALIVLATVDIVRVFATGISARRRLNVILSVLAILAGVAVLATLSFFDSATLLYMLAAGVLVIGIAHVARDTAGEQTVGTFAILLALTVFLFPILQGIVAVLVIPLELLFPDFTYPEVPEALVTGSLMLVAMERLIVGILGI